MSRLIYEEDAIDAVSGGMCSGWDCDVIDKLKAVPSAESEIIHCTECKHSHLTYDGKNKYCVHWPNNAFSPTEYLDGGFYCGFAKRREE